MSPYKFILVLIVFLGIISCKNSQNQITISPEVTILEEGYKKEPTDENFSKLIQKLAETAMSENDMSKKESILLHALDLGEQSGKPNISNTFALELIKTNPNSERSKSYLWKIATDMKTNGKVDVANILFKGYATLFPTDVKSAEILKNEPSTTKDIPSYLKTVASSVFDNPGERGLNVENTQKYIDLCESYALVFPKDTISSTYLFRASEMSRAIGTIPKTMSLYDWISTYFPDSKNASMAFFLKGFTLENDLKQMEKAKEIYTTFLAKYPNDPMVKDVKFLLENLGKSDKEIMEQIEKKQ